jgi:hypothetical protein
MVLIVFIDHILEIYWLGPWDPTQSNHLNFVTRPQNNEMNVAKTLEPEKVVIVLQSMMCYERNQIFMNANKCWKETNICK